MAEWRCGWVPLLARLLMLAAASPSHLAAQAVARPAAAATAPQLQFQSARTCQPCHAEVYREWASSFMAQGWTNPLFQLEFGRFLASQGAGSAPENPLRATCLRCHAPVAVLTGDLGLRKAVSREGVTCEVCHRVAIVRDKPQGNGLVIDPEPRHQYGRRESANAFHEVRQAAMSNPSALCGGCHLDLDPASGLALERTYLEWQQGPAARRGLACASCHMPPTPTAAAARPHASHRFPGGHADSPLLKGAIRLEIAALADTRFRVTVENAAGGHNFPTGGAHPARAVLKVEWRDRRGKPLHVEERSFAYGDKLARGGIDPRRPLVDTTLKPAERRQLDFALPDGVDAQTVRSVRASLSYRLLPEGHERDLPRSFYESRFRPVLMAEASADVVAAAPAKVRPVPRP